MPALSTLLEKYGDILKEEINVKELDSFVSDTPIIRVFKPLWSQLSTKFGKDTGQIIANGKQGNVREVEWWIEVFDLNGNTRTLSEDEYEIVYEGIEGDNITIEGNMIIKLDLELTESLKREGIARELSRFLNQMRKDADFAVDARVQMKYETADEELKKLIEEFSEFFQEEALLQRLEVGTPNGDAVAEFESDGKKVQISLSR